jgi:antirestriction protein ArdC
MSKSTATNPTTAKLNICQVVTDRILASLKNGIIPWQKPWQAPTYAGGIFPRNFRTGKPYRGVNVFLLWSTPYSAPFWLTFKQAQELGGNVRKGEKGTQIVFYKQLNGKAKQTEEQLEEPTDDKGNRRSFVLTCYTVFNVEQCQGINLPEMLPATEPNEVEMDKTCEAIVQGWDGRPQLQLTSTKERHAYYRPATDSVHMPARFRFVDASLYYATLFHELVHSTGHESRLNRSFGASFGDDLYSKEELVAETGAAFLCALAGVANDHTESNTTAYIQNWIQQLEEDNRLILQAAAAAQKAVDMITGQNLTEPEEQPA